MAISKKPVRIGSAHTLPFEKLSPGEFERLSLWLVAAEKFGRPELLGEGGRESGRDVVGWKNGRRWVFLCKRVSAFSLSHAKNELAKLRSLPVEQQPDELVFILSQTVRAETRQSILAEWGDEATCHFWSGNELDERVKRHPKLLAEFFSLPPETIRVGRVIHLPHASLGDLFQGREGVLALLHEKLTKGKPSQATAIASKAIHGLGGEGKTRLAVEYAWRYAAEYSAVLFAGAETPEDLRQNFAALSGPTVLNLPEQEATDEEVKVSAVLRHLAEQPGWLLILDNIDSEEAAEGVDRLVAQLHGGRVLLTGRLADWGSAVEAIPLDMLTEQAAAEFLLARTASHRKEGPDDLAQAVSLARELGSLPLALELAGTYIAERRMSLSGYLKDWHSRHEQILSWFDSRLSHYPASVATTWQTTVDRLTNPARRLLERIAWLGPESIPEALLTKVPEPPEGAVHNPAAALAELATYSLVSRSANEATVTIHPLVRDVTRRSLQGDPDNARFAEVLRWVKRALAEDPTTTFRPHPIEDGCPPAWASGWGEDEFGIFAEFSVGEAIQRMRWIEPGKFWMGSPEDEPGRYDDEGPRHLEVLDEGFWLADTPCTQVVWEGVMGANPSRFRTPDRPIEQVSWEDCQEFCRKLGERLGGPGWRLPGEAEWEYACRAGTETATYAGPIEIQGTCNAPVLGPIAWYGGNSGDEYDLEEFADSSEWPEKEIEHARAGTRRVKSKEPNTWGLYDTLGNVWEWCEDLRSEGYDSERMGPSRVFRGGTWRSDARHVRAAYRFWSSPGVRSDDLGFRLARGQESALQQGAEPGGAERPRRGRRPRPTENFSGPKSHPPI